MNFLSPQAYDRSFSNGPPNMMQLLIGMTQRDPAFQLPSEHHAAVRGHPMDLEYVLRQIENDDCNLSHVLLP